MSNMVQKLTEPSTSTSRVEHFDYHGLRLVVGLLGFVLPIALVLRVNVFTQTEMLLSISAYYHSSGRDIFVGSLCVIAMFLLAYRGKAKIDGRFSTLAGIACLGIAFFPTAPLHATAEQMTFSLLHILSAGVFFLMLAVFCLLLFPNAPRFMALEQRTIYEVRRDRVYRFCGWSILVCLLLILTTKIFPGAWVAQWRPVFFLEWFALAMFGVSWITAGKYWRISYLVSRQEGYRMRNL